MWDTKDKKKKQTFLAEQIITGINLFIVFRLLFSNIDIDYFRDTLTGKINTFGECIKIAQSFFEGLTEPIIAPFKAILSMFLNNADKDILNVIAPIITIVSLMLINVLVKIYMPYINDYIKKKNDI